MRLLSEFLARPPSARVLIGALVVSIGWSIVGFPIFAANVDEELLILVLAGLVGLLLTLWEAVLVRRLLRGRPRTGRWAVITLLILTVPVFLPPAHPLTFGLGAAVLALVAVAVALGFTERRATHTS